MLLLHVNDKTPTSGNVDNRLVYFENLCHVLVTTPYIWVRGLRVDKYEGICKRLAGVKRLVLFLFLSFELSAQHSHYRAFFGRNHSY